jgi:hypothetical protein
MANIFVRCPAIGCRQLLGVPEESRGMLLTCQFCKRPLRIPQKRLDTAPAAPPASPPGRPKR